MLNILLGVSLSLFAAAAALYTVGAFKGMKLLENISKPFLTAAVILAHALLTAAYLPDSMLLLVYGSIALIFALAGSILFIFKENRTLKIIASSFFIMSILSKLLVTFPSFRLYRFPVFISILFAVLYSAAALLLFMFFIKKKNPLISVIYAAIFTAIGIYAYSAILTFSGELRIYSVFLFMDSVSIAFSAFVKTKKEAEKLSSPLPDFFSVISCAASQVFFAAGPVMMQAL